MPKKAVIIFFLLALLGAAAFVYFTFPRTKDEIPHSNNQRPFPSAPEPGPNGLPVPETVPHPNTPAPPPGPKLRVMAWATADEAKALAAMADAFQAETGSRPALTIENEADYRRDLQEALASTTPPDVCLISARDFSGLDPAGDLAEVPAPADVPQRCLQAFTQSGLVRAVPDEFSVDVLFYNPLYFDQAGIGYPDRHWNWDILEAISRALAATNIHTASGQQAYPLELGADFDLWNILCMQAGHPALDLDVWHLTDTTGRESQIRALDFIQDFFHNLSVTAPLPKGRDAPGQLFAQQRAALLIAPSELAATLPKFNYAYTLLPSDMVRASLARVNGWAVSAKSAHRQEALALAFFLAKQPVHAGWCSAQKPSDPDAPNALCYEALEQALLPRIGAQTQPLAQFLDDQINQLARHGGEKSEALYARIQAEYQRGGYAPAVVETGVPKPAPKVEAGQLRGL